MPLTYDLEMFDIDADETERKLYKYNRVSVEGLRCFGWQERRKAGIGSPWHYHKDCFEIHYIYDGTLSFRVKEKEYWLKAGDIFITFPNEYHGSGDNPFAGHKLFWFNLLTLKQVLGLGEEQTQALFEKLYQIKHRVIPATADMRHMMEQVHTHILTDDPYERLVANGQMLAFLQRLIENDAAMEQVGISSEINQAIEFMKQNLHNKHSLADVAKQIGLSLSYFKAKFKREIGISPADYYMDLRIAKAKELLLSGKSVTETAYELDFVSSNYFSVVFRRVTAKTPTQFVKEYR
ncbi:MAG: helix-turn-helix transcriptional regulator [Clostridia bacterium]|nr:helix-turn-helix transcriptional regulator [Clostridia bacterium]